MKAINVNKLTKAGCTFKFWVADWFAQLNNKMGGDLKKIQTVGRWAAGSWHWSTDVVAGYVLVAWWQAMSWWHGGRLCPGGMVAGSVWRGVPAADMGGLGTTQPDGASPAPLLHRCCTAAAPLQELIKAARGAAQCPPYTLSFTRLPPSHHLTLTSPQVHGGGVEGSGNGPHPRGVPQ
jgi:hypothetical protein